MPQTDNLTDKPTEDQQPVENEVSKADNLENQDFNKK